MIITAPVTDYIPASLLTLNGSMIERRTDVIVESGPGAYGNVLSSVGVGFNRSNIMLAGILNQYLKAGGAGVKPTYSPLALRDTGIHIGLAARSSADDQIISGVPFESSVVIFITIDDITTNDLLSIGFDNITYAMCMWRDSDTPSTSIVTDASLKVYRDGSNHLSGRLSAFSASGFTIYWTLVGTCAATFIYLCLP